MQPAAREISTCPDCGQTLEETSGGRLGCIACLLRTGISGEDDLPRHLNPDAFEGDGHFGVYRIDRRDHESLYKLGHGAMGTTYRATDMSLQRKVALKIIRLGIAGRSKEARERFLREARAAAAVRHENIATVFQFGIREETGQCFYAMELIEGETLEERVRRAGPLDTRTTIVIAQQVTAALAAAEKRGLIHRDLKPANLMLVDSDESQVVGRDRWARRERAAQHAVPAVKIIDFGLAKALHAPIDPMRLTHDGFLGTPAFASPEQFENSALDVRSDIYSLGVTLWFALTGKTPFAGRSVQEIHRAQESNVLPIGQLKSARVPSRLRLLLKSMLAFEPATRPGTHKLAAELRRCAAQATGARRTRLVLAAVATLIPVASASFVFYSLRTHSAPPSSAATLIPVASASFVFHSPRTHSAPPSSGLNPALPEKSPAVLPFENLSSEPDSAFLAHVLHDDVLTKLANIADLKIISRTSVMRYSGKEDVLEGLAERDPRAAASDENVFGGDTVHFNQIFIDSVVARTATTPAPFVEMDQKVIPTMKRYRASPQIAQERSQYKRINRKRTLWDKLRYGWASKHPYHVKKK
jgi:serine/threonine protein kinase